MSFDKVELYDTITLEQILYEKGMNISWNIQTIRKFPRRLE